MKKIKLVILLTLLTRTFASHGPFLENFIQKYSELYSYAGNDNNYIEYAFYNNTDFKQIFSENEISRLRKIDIKDSFKHVNNCIFMTRGAYGSHIENNQSVALSNIFIRDLRENLALNNKVFLINQFQMELINNRCGLFIVDEKSNQSILFQGVSFD